MNQALTKQRLRIRFGKFGDARYIGHLDLAKTWERILRRADIPLEYTQGFNPRPRMQFAAALTVGVTSEAEYLDIWLIEPLVGNLETDWITALNAVSPAGIETLQITEVPIKSDSLPVLVSHADYVITAIDPALSPYDLAARAESLLARETIMREGRKKPYDLRPLILNLTPDADGNLIAQLKTGDRGNARPDELLDALDVDMGQVRIHRQHLRLEGND